MNAVNSGRVISVREYATLSTDPVAPSLDCAQISETAFDYLCNLSERFSKNGARLLQVGGRRHLKLDSHVGVVQTPCGTTVEIVPKHHREGDDLIESRLLLRKLLLASLNVSARDVGPAALQLFNAPLSEWVIHQFLRELETLLIKGLRFEYKRVEEELPFLRGQLDISRQLRQPPGRDHRFHVRHEVFQSERPENRLLKLALERVRLHTQDPDNWRLAQELSFRLFEIPPSINIQDDFRAWKVDRLLTHYKPVRAWCELVLGEHMPQALAGDFRGQSLLFPMEKLFERYVARWFRQQLPSEAILRTPARSECLCEHDGSRIFQLQPDLYVTHQGRSWVMDTKWKILDVMDVPNNYQLKQSDFYQLFAYGQKYLKGTGHMALIYPWSSTFKSPLPPFDFGDGLTLSVLPFDLDHDKLMGVDRLQLPSFESLATV